MPQSPSKSLEERIAALEAARDSFQEIRRSVIPDELWNSRQMAALKEHQARHCYESMYSQLTSAERAAEDERNLAAEKQALRDQQESEGRRQEARVKAMFERAVHRLTEEGGTVQEARLLAAVECYESYRTVPPGFRVEQKPAGGVIIRPEQVV